MNTLLVALAVFLVSGNSADGHASCLRLARVSKGKWLNVGYQNDWDKHLKSQCFNGALTGMYSIHNSKKEDRRFDFACSSIYDGKSRKNTGSCFWNVYSVYDAHVQYNCPPNMFLAGWESKHNNRKEDRIMRFKCCTANRLIIHGCRGTSYINQFDKVANYIAPVNRVLTGVYTYHSNRHEDRRFAFRVCKAFFF